MKRVDNAPAEDDNRRVSRLPGLFSGALAALAALAAFVALLALTACLADGDGDGAGEGEAEGEGEGEGEGENLGLFEGGPHFLECRCSDGNDVVSGCTSSCVTQQAECTVACRDRGQGSPSCFENQARCLVPAETLDGPNAVICPCPGEPDTGLCTTLACDDEDDAAVIEDACALACPDASVAPICVNGDAGCDELGAPQGRDIVRCGCDDGSVAAVCTTSVCGGLTGVADEVCDRACGGASFGIQSCDFHDFECALRTDVGGPNVVECQCEGFRAFGVCTSLPCDDAPALLHDECIAACAQGVGDPPPPAPGPPLCRADAQCANGEPPLGSDLTICTCADDQFFATCGINCDPLGVCGALCADHGGPSFPEGCHFRELTCLSSRGLGGANAVFCDCEFFDDAAACVDVACDDQAALDGICGDYCVAVEGETFVASCVESDVGCVNGELASGPNEALCTCADGTSTSRCVMSCRDDRVIGECFGFCAERGGIQNPTCEPSAACGAP